MSLPILTVAALRDRLAALPGDYEVWAEAPADDGVPVVRPVVVAVVDEELGEVRLR